MDALEAMRTVGTTRFYLPDDVPDEVDLRRGRGGALRAPGRQPPAGATRPRPRAGREGAPGRALPALVAGLLRGGRRAAPGALGEYASARRALLDANRFAEHLAEHPVIVVVCAKLADLHITDAEHGRPPVVGGASIYPFVQNLCLALRVQGVATRDHDPALRLRARGQGAARDPRGLPDRLPRGRRLPGARLPEEADPGAGRGGPLPRALRRLDRRPGLLLLGPPPPRRPARPGSRPPAHISSSSR